ncbi:MAG: 6-phosphofructokinase [Planctomycetota bacterium]|nr:MAG: 6-phosphofructokinase [Planctomycetota bacterium]
MAVNVNVPPTTPRRKIDKVALVFSGGPAPAANAVISTCAVSFLRNGSQVVGLRHGYSRVLEYDPQSHPLQEGRDFIPITHQTLKRTRNTGGILIGTARANPGQGVDSPADLKNERAVAGLKTVYDALRSIGVDALVSIGGDDTLRTANKFKLFQDHWVKDPAERIPVVHVPKTIDNDYDGIDFTFGYFTAAEFLAQCVRNILADAEAGANYFICEVMGRNAGWLAYATGIAGEASLTLSVEDLDDDLLTTEEFEDEKTKQKKTRVIMQIDKVVDLIVDKMLLREAEGKEYGVVVMAEGMALKMPKEHLEGIKLDPFGHPKISEVQLGKKFAELVAERYQERTGREREVKSVQLGYEARCARPQAYDVLLGSQLGVGAFRALAEHGLDGHMVSVHGQFELRYVPFEELVNPENLVTRVRFVKPGSDFHRLVRFLETYNANT